MSIGMKLKALLNSKGMTIADLAKATGFSHQRVSHYVHETRNMPFDLVEVFATALGITSQELLFDENVSAQDNKGTNQYGRIAVLYLGAVPAGAWAYPTGDNGMTIEISNRFSDEPNICACKISGTSLMPRFQDGQTVVIKKSSDPVPGRVWLAENQDHEVTLKVLDGRPGAWVLKPINPDSEPVAPVAEWSLIGYAIGVEEYNPDGIRP